MASREKTGSGTKRSGTGPIRKRHLKYAAGALGVVLAVGAGQIVLDRRFAEPSESSYSPDRTLRAFKPDSWWNTRLPDDAPAHPANKQILEHLRTGPGSRPGCLLLGGTSGTRFGTPIFWATPEDPEYAFEQVRYKLPPELEELRMPRDARPVVDGEGTMTIYDVDKGYVVGLSRPSYDEATDVWSATGATVTYLDSNGLHRRTGRSDDPRNTGVHRGNNGAVWAVSWDQVETGEIGHVLNTTSGPPLSSRFIFPMVASDGSYTGRDRGVPPAGIRLRLKPSVDLDALGLDPAAEVIAETLQEFGVYIGGSAGKTALNLENTEAEGRGELWSLRRDALCGLPFSPRYWEVIAESFDPTRPAG